MYKNNQGAKVVVAIPVVNQVEYTIEAVKSLKMDQPFVTLIIDNGSTDGTEEWLKSMAGKPNFACIRYPKNLGCAAAWNEAIRIGLSTVGADYVFILNNDLLVKPETLDLMLKVLTWENVGLVSARDVSGELSRSLDIFDLPTPNTDKITETPDFSCFAVKRETIKKVGLFDEAFYPAYFEDNDFHYRLKLANLSGSCYHKATYFHYGSRTQTISPEFKAYLGARYVKNREYYVKKWGGEPGHETFDEAFNGHGPKTIELDDCGFDPEAILAGSPGK